jgi:hypothetical protein
VGAPFSSGGNPISRFRTERYPKRSQGVPIGCSHKMGCEWEGVLGRSARKRAEMTGSDRILICGRAQVRSSGSTVDEVIYPGPSWVRCGSTSGLGWGKTAVRINCLSNIEAFVKIGRWPADEIWRYGQRWAGHINAI